MERHLKAGDHVIVYGRNRALADGKTSRVSLGDCPLLAVSTAGCLCVVLVIVAAVGLSGDLDLVGALLAGLFALLFLGVALVLGRATVSCFRERARLQAHGGLVTGEVTRVEAGYTTSPSYPPGARAPTYQLNIFYRFFTATGEERTGEGSLFQTPERAHRKGQVWLGGQLRPVPSPGDRLAILYADGTEEWVM